MVWLALVQLIGVLDEFESALLKELLRSVIARRDVGEQSAWVLLGQCIEGFSAKPFAAVLFKNKQPDFPHMREVAGPDRFIICMDDVPREIGL